MFSRGHELACAYGCAHVSNCHRTIPKEKRSTCRERDGDDKPRDTDCGIRIAGCGWRDTESGIRIAGYG